MYKYVLIAIFSILSNIANGQNKISIDSAGSHIGENVVVCSEVFGVKETEKVTFINLGAPYPNSPLTIVIFTKDLSNFKENPPSNFNSKKICVTGKLQDYKGKTEIVIT